MFSITAAEIDVAQLRKELFNSRAGAIVVFEGIVRDHNDGLPVKLLEYEAYEQLAQAEGQKILSVAAEKFGVLQCLGVHRVGALAVGETAVWIGVLAEHRDEAFAACQFIINEVKHRLPIWKKEHYADGHSGWVNCQHKQVKHGQPLVADEVPPAADWQLDILDMSGADLRKLEVINISDGANSAAYDHLWSLLHCKVECRSSRDIASQPAQLNTALNYLFVCEDGCESGRLVSELRRQGYKNVFSLVDGLKSLRRKMLA